MIDKMSDKFKPKVVLALILKDNQLLLVKRTLPSLKLEWALPGGVTQQGEAIEESIVRELKERLDIDIVAEKTISERKHPNTFVQAVYIKCKMKDDSQKPRIRREDKYEEVEWVNLKESLDRFTSDVDPKIEKFIKSHIK